MRQCDSAGIRSKHRTFADGTVFGGHKLSRGALYLMLQNRIYCGEITHKGNAYAGEHKAILDKSIWDKVQAVLAESAEYWELPQQRISGQRWTSVCGTKRTNAPLATRCSSATFTQLSSMSASGLLSDIDA